MGEKFNIKFTCNMLEGIYHIICYVNSCCIVFFSSDFVTFYSLWVDFFVGWKSSYYKNIEVTDLLEAEFWVVYRDKHT